MANVFRADHIGTLAKPSALLRVEEAYGAGGAEANALRAAQDIAIQEALALQKRVVMTIVSDGEFRRGNTNDPYVHAIDGLGAADARVAGSELHSAYGVAGKISATRRLFDDEASFLQRSAGAAFKISMLTPSSLALRFYKPEIKGTPYRSIVALAEALRPIIRRELAHLPDEGVSYLQLDAPAYFALHEGAGRRLPGLPELDWDSAFDSLVAVDAALIADLPHQDTAAVALHVPRTEGVDDQGDRYERMIAVLLQRLSVDRVLLEYAEPREHDFQALQALPAKSMAVLGLVRTDGRPEEIGEIIDRLSQAARHVPEERLALSPRSGFRNHERNNFAAEWKAQERTLIRASEVVQQFWGLEL